MLEIVRELLQALNEQEISYCCWKGSSHLNDSLNGKSDLDILVSKRFVQEINIILWQCGFKRFASTNAFNQVAVENFLGIDPKTGSFVHIHLYYELRIGSLFIADYHLPVEEEILKHTLRNESGINVLDPNLEMILLIIRYALKNSKKLKNDFYFLLPRITPDQLYYQARIIFGLYFADLAHNLLEAIKLGRIGLLLKNSKKIKTSLKSYKTAFTGINILCYLSRYLRAGVRHFALKYAGLPWPVRRARPAGGLIIAFVGVDGSGKSTLVKETGKWLKWKLDVYPIYFGSGDGKSSWLMYPLRKVFKHLKKSGMNTRLKNPCPQHKAVSKKWLVARTLWAITLGLDKKRKFKRLWLARCRGMLVICDRYPQQQICGINDGPLLAEWILSKNPVKKAAANWEKKIYSLADIYYPDLVLMLNPPPETAHARKPEASLEAIKKKSMLLKELKYHNNTRIYEINTSIAMAESLLEIKKIIAENL